MDADTACGVSGTLVKYDKVTNNKKGVLKITVPLLEQQSTATCKFIEEEENQEPKEIDAQYLSRRTIGKHHR